MDSSGYKIEFLGNSCGQHGSYTFYKGIQYWKDDQCRRLSLGEFFHGRLNSNDQVIPLIGELQLLWEEKHHEGLKLSSVRLYILPENCPCGRLPNHGQDEILAEDHKIVLRVEDLMTLVVHEPVVWTQGLLATSKIFSQIDLPSSKEFKSDALAHCLPYAPEGNSDSVLNESSSTKVVILSYPRYCRYRAALKRFEGCSNRWLADFLISAIGGFATCSTVAETRVMFCRNTVEHPVLMNYECRMNHLAPSLKGRRRKKRPKSKPNESEDSNESETNSEKNAQRCALTAEGSVGKRRPSEKLSESNQAKPIVKKSAVTTEKGFLKRLHKFMNDRGTPIVRIPILGFKEVDLFQFYQCTQQLGGYDVVTEKRLWKLVYDQLGGSSGNTSAATGARKIYEKLLLDFERHFHAKKKPSPSDGELKTVRLGKSFLKQNSDSQTDQEMEISTAEETSVEKDRIILKPAEINAISSASPVNAPSETSTEPMDVQPDVQLKVATRPSKQKKLLRKASMLNGLNIKNHHSTGNDVDQAFGVEEKSKKDFDKNSAANTADPLTKSTEPCDAKSATPSATSSAEPSAADEEKLIRVSLKNKDLPIKPCTISVVMMKDKSSESKSSAGKDTLDATALPIKVEKTDAPAKELTDSSCIQKTLLNYICPPTGSASPALEVKSNENRSVTPSTSVTSKSKKSLPCAGTEVVSLCKESSANTLSGLIKASSVSQKLLSGGHAVVESGIMDENQPDDFLNNKLKPCTPNIIPNVMPNIVPNVLPAKLSKDKVISSKLSVVPQMPNDATSSRYSLGVITHSSSLLLADNSSNKANAFPPSLNKLGAKQTGLMATPVPITIDLIHSNDKELSEKLFSTTQPLSVNVPNSPGKQLVSGVPKRNNPFGNNLMESHIVSAKRRRLDSDNSASSLPIQTSPQSYHHGSVISSPIKRFIDSTKTWTVPGDPVDSAMPENLSWSADDQPTDLSMKTLMSQQNASNLPQTEPLDLSKTSTTFPNAKIKCDSKPVILPSCTVAGSSVLKTSQLLSASPNKVALVAPSLRSTSNMSPAASYQISNLQSATTLTSSVPQNLQTVKPEHLAPLVAYAPSFHPAFQILSAPIFSAIAASGSLLSNSSNSVSSPRLAVPFFPVIPITQTAPGSSNDMMSSLPEVGTAIPPSILRRPNKKS